MKRAQREFWTDFCPAFGQNAARKAGMKRYEKKRKNENRGFYDFTKSAVFEDEFVVLPPTLYPAQQSYFHARTKATK